jgi:hypothetical protein
MTWKWWLAMAVVLGAFIAAGQIVAAQTRSTEAQVSENRDALVTVCATLDTLGFVFEQLQVADKSIAKDASLSPTVRLQVQNRANLYGTAVEALSSADQNCEQIE